MLWRFSFASASNVDAILSRETPPSVEELMDEQEILNECKAQNNKLVTYLSKDDSVKSLLQWVISGLDELDQAAVLANSASFDHAVSSPLYPSYQQHAAAVPGPGPDSPPLEPAKVIDEPKPEVSFPDNMNDIGLGQGLERTESRESDTSRYPQIATEILTSELWTISETIMSNKEALLQPFWDAVLPPIDPSDLTAQDISERERARDEFWSDEDEERDRKREVIRGMWTRVNGALMQKRTHEMIRFIQSLPDIVSRIMAQIASPAVQDMLIRIVSAEEAGVSGVIEWLANEGLVPQLLAQLSPECSINGHSVASELLKSIITLCAPAPFNPNGGNTMEANAQPGVRDNRLIRELVSASSINTMIGFMLDPLELSDADWHGLNGKDEPPHPADPFVVHPLPSIASATSSLSHVCNILVEIIRRNNSDFSEPHLFHTLRHRLMMIQGEAAGSDARDQMEEALGELTSKMGIVHLGHLIATLSDRFADLHQILMRQKAVLGLDRFRVVELYAELLHSSNMSILNRPPGSGPTYTKEGILAGGLAGLEALGEAVEGEHGDDEAEVETPPKVGTAGDVPISAASTPTSESEASVDEEMLGSDASTSPRNTGSPTNVESPAPTESAAPASAPADASVTPEASTNAAAGADDAAAASTPAAAASTDTPASAPAGDRLKQMYITHHVLPDVVNLFFDYPNNDFMHHVVYDLLQQILNGRLGPGVNRELVVELLCEAKLVERILDAQRLNDEVVKEKHRPRLPYMGHIILISEELVKFFARCPPELHDRIADSFIESEWAAFVEGSLSETKERDARPLAGGRPTGAAAAAAAAEAAEEDSSDDDEDDNREHAFGEPLSRTVAQGAFGGSGFDTFNDRDDADEFWTSQPRRHADSSDEDDDDADWMRPSSANLHGGSDDEDFGAFNTTSRGGDTDELDDDGWGTFTSSSSADDGENPFGDDNFAPSVAPLEISRPTPLTPYDWASQFDSEFADPDDSETIVIPDMGDDDEADEAEAAGDTDAAENITRDTSGLTIDPKPTPISPSTIAPALAAPISVPTHKRRRSTNVSSPPKHAFSPPEPSLIQASSDTAPLGPGVSADTHVNASGMLEKEVDGQKLTVPADEVVRGVEEALESGSAPLGLEKVQSREA